MTIQDEIRLKGITLASEFQILENKKLHEITYSTEIVYEFIERLLDDILEFNTLNQFDLSYQNLCNRAYMYCFGKGAEVAFFDRMGYDMTYISYDFDKLMQGVCGEKLPDALRFKVHQKSSALLEIYTQQFQMTKGSLERMISEGLTFNNLIYTILNGAFFYGVEIALRSELTAEDKLASFQEEIDNPYDYDTYDQRYKLNDYKSVKINFGDFNDIKSQLGL